MIVKTYEINKGTPSHYYGLMCIDSDGESFILHYAPNNWKTEKGALNWARKHGLKEATEK